MKEIFTWKFVICFAVVLVGLAHIDNVHARSLADIGSYEVEEKDFVYARADGQELWARSYRPKKEGILPAAVEVHGGAWNLYDRTAGELYNRALASSGLFVMAVEFRQGPKFKHPLGSRDVSAALRYLQIHADALSIDADSVGLIGSSSGGHLAMLAGIKPNAPEHRGTEVVEPEGSSSATKNVKARYIVALWPVSDPFYRFEYAKRIGRDELQRMHLGYFADEASMRDASIKRVIDDGEAEKPLPPMLLVQPGADTNIPLEMTEAVIASYQKADGKLHYVFYPGQPHAFAHRPSAATDDCIRTMRDFIERQLR